MEPVKDQPASIDDKVRAQAFADIDAIRQLRGSRPFVEYFCRRLDEKAAPLRESILRDPLAFEDYRRKQAQLHQIEEIAALLDADDAANKRIIGDPAKS